MRPMDSSARQPHVPYGINLYGYLTASLGLGVAARNTAEMLSAAGIPLKLIDVNPGGGMQGRDRSLSARIENSADLPYHRINLFHINPDQMLYLLSPFHRRVELDGRLNVCVPFWELPRLPDTWIEPLRGMDAILAPTRFVEAAVKSSLPGGRIIHYPQAVHVPADIAADRARFGLPADAFTFVTSFDMRSDIERKNPWGAIEAFHSAFPDRTDVRLVIKVNNVETIAGLERHVRRLRDVAADSRVIVLDQPMSYRDVLGLYASCDALVSLHRSEGLGLSLLEAMALGKPVVATGWSGNMDFMTPQNSIPIAFSEVEVVSSTQPAYGKAISGTQHWAEPDIGQAAMRMRQLSEQPELAARIGATARDDVRALTARFDSGGDVLPALKKLAAQSPDETDASQVMQHLRREYPVNQARRISRAAMNRLRTRLGI